MTSKEQYKQGDYGFYSLSRVLDLYMAESFNVGRKYYKNMLIIAAGVYKELFWKALRTVKKKRVPIDAATMTVRLPHDCLRLVALRIKMDCDLTEFLTYDARRYITPIQIPVCGCKACGCTNPLCAELHDGFDYIEEDVTLGGVVYKRAIKTRLCANGDLLQEISEPYAVKGTEGAVTVSFRTRHELVETLTLKPCGCVEETALNAKKCCDTRGVLMDCCSVDCNGVTPGPGTYKMDDEDPCHIYLFDTTATHLDIIYFTNGEECAEEILVPEYCKEAMFAGLYLGSIRFRSNVQSYEKRAARTEWAYEKQELFEFLNPLIPHEFIDLQYSFPKW